METDDQKKIILLKKKYYDSLDKCRECNEHHCEHIPYSFEGCSHKILQCGGTGCRPVISRNDDGSIQLEYTNRKGIHTHRHVKSYQCRSHDDYMSKFVCPEIDRSFRKMEKTMDTVIDNISWLATTQSSRKNKAACLRLAEGLMKQKLMAMTKKFTEAFVSLEEDVEEDTEVVDL